jgi:hypothetical protein
MDIDKKFPQFRSFMSDTKLGNGGVKTSLDQSAVSAGEQSNVDLNLSAENEKEKSSKNKDKKREENDKMRLNKNSDERQETKNKSISKDAFMRLLNLI